MSDEAVFQLVDDIKQRMADSNEAVLYVNRYKEQQEQHLKDVANPERWSTPPAWVEPLIARLAEFTDDQLWLFAYRYTAVLPKDHGVLFNQWLVKFPQYIETIHRISGGPKLTAEGDKNYRERAAR